MIQPPDAFGVSRVVYGGGGATTRLVCGFMGGNEQLHPLLSSLPSAILVDVANLPGGDWIAATFTYAARTLAYGDAGTAAVVAKVSDGTGWATARIDPKVTARVRRDMPVLEHRKRI